MSKTIRLSPEQPAQPIVRYGQPGLAKPAYSSWFLALVAVAGIASLISWYGDEFSVENRANRGDAKAQYLVGKRCFDEARYPGDYARAARLIRKAAEQGYAKAQTGLGLLYENGLGVRKDYNQALSWLGKAADQGFPIAQNELGVMYAKGRGVARSFETAAHWCRLAAAQGSEIARRNLELAQVAQGAIIPELTTSARQSYRRVLLQQVDPDGVTISFSPVRGGFGIAKLKLENLPSALQELCRYAGKQGIASDTAYSHLSAVSTTL